MKNEHLGKVSGVIDTVMTGASLVASVLAVLLAKYISISSILGIVAAIILASGLVFIIVTKTKKMDQTALVREEEMKLFIESQKAAKKKQTFAFETADVEEVPAVNP